ncbi:hypothetical protein D9758_013877 [Tetrapyrgos nigripes]|uniref:Cytochrome P450 n=1 Tax=Tetrapyrgos nigripes TaxID=182062 RepID=A0A8H5FRE4_9AGAR|nr:hypothetical protein D9758_013877 [Tetrapyrgos nigripes]
MAFFHVEPVYLGLLIGLLIGAFLQLHLKRRSKSALPYPPGPRPLPIIGNILDLSSSFQWRTFIEWTVKYDSDILHFTIGGSSTIVLNSLEAANELLEKRGKIYSSRPQFPMLNFIGWDWTFVIMPYGSRWSAHRKLFTKEFNPNLPERYEPQELRVVATLLERLLQTPEDFVDHIRHARGAAIMDVTYGIKVLPYNDPYINEAERALESFVAAAIPGSFWLDFFPGLKHIPEWFPGASFKTKAKKWRREASIMLNHPYEDVKKRVANGELEACYVYHCLQNIDENGDIELQERDIQQTAGTMYGAGSDTIIASIRSFFLAMVLNPEVQRKAQKHLDEMINLKLKHGHLDNDNPNRLPNFSDRDLLPYITAIMYEVYRTQPVNPLGIAHMCEVDDEYKGYYIPKNSVVIANIWGIFRDEKTYPEPNKFNPDRWMSSDGKSLNPNLREPVMHFGYGRRLCPGRHLANAAIWITIASVLFAFDISKAVDEHGNVIEPTGEYISSLVNYPAPFRCKIKARSEQHERLIRSSVV